MRGGLARWVVPALALAGLAGALWYSGVASRRDQPPASLLAEPSTTPFVATVSGSGLIEANTRNISVGSFVDGIVAEVAVVEGQQVQPGAPLFVLDRRLLAAEVAIAEREVAAAQARIGQAEAELADQQDQLRRVEGLDPGISVSKDRLARVRFAERTARTRLVLARTQEEVARSQLQAAQVRLDRLTVRAPVAGRVLKVNVRPGEFVRAGESADPLVLLGGDRPLHVRVQIDENDLWRLSPAASAEAVVRGNRALRFPLALVRVEPWVLPKRSLTGERTERTDTRVLEVIYRFDPDDRPIFIGQQVDVFIEADPRAVPGSPLPAAATATPAGGPQSQ